jgi:hypothetical protein
LNVASKIYVGPVEGVGTIYLGGGSPDDADYDMSVIETRSYASNKSEMVLFKGNDGPGSDGPDRIRLRAAAIAFDTFSSLSTDRAAENIRMLINSSGQVGIGTTTPGFLLDVAGTSRITGNTSITSTTASTSSSTGALTVSGGVGIAGDINLSSSSTIIFPNPGGSNPPATGTRSAGTKLVLYSSVGPSSVDSAIGVSNSTVWYSVPTGNVHNFYHGTVSSMTISASQTSILHTTASTSTSTGALTVSGGVGIAGNLNVGGGLNVGATTISVATPGINNPISALTLLGDTGGGVATLGARFKLSRYESSGSNARTRMDIELVHGDGTVQNVMAIRSDGNLGVGTAAPRMRSTVHDTNAKMAIVSTAETQASALYFGTPQTVNVISNAYKTAIIAQGINGWSRNNLHFCLNNNSNSNAASEDATIAHSRMVITPVGNVGIGTTTPGFLLDVNGTFICRGNANFSFIDSNLAPFGYGAGEVGFNSRPWSKMHAGEFNIASDARQKKDIAVYSEGLAFITQLVPKTYKYKHVITDKTKIGFLAQEVLQVNPTFAGVNYDETEDTYTMTMDQFTGPLVNCIKELNTELLATKNELLATKNELLAMRTFIESKFPGEAF